MKFRKPLLTSLLCGLCLLSSATHGAELIKITKDNYQDIVPKGKEVDAIYGDFILRNDQIVAVIAQPVAGRKANMTVRGVAGMIIDYTRRNHGSDQLSCFYPAAGRFLFEDAAGMGCNIDGKSIDCSQIDKVSGKSVELSFQGTPVAEDGTGAKVTYMLSDQKSWIEYRVELTNSSDSTVELLAEDSLRCDGTLFETAVESDPNFFYAYDMYFGQCYAFTRDGSNIETGGIGRNLTLKSTNSTQPTESGKMLDWSGKVYCSQGLPGAKSWALSITQNAATALQPMQLKLQCPQGPVAHAKIEFSTAGRSLGTIQSDNEGIVRTELLPGDYQARIESIGRDVREHSFTVSNALTADTLTLPSASRVRATVVDGDGQPIAAKVQFYGIEPTPDPDFGPDSAVDAIKNVVYSAHGNFEQPIAPGRYRVLISHGTEYDAETVEIEVADGQLLPLETKLPRTVDTTGWVSADFHSHSSQSGDNVSEQRGRVLNLLAEHIEFAPCTEHNRIDTYEDDLIALAATSDMATCTGIELTGSPLPINHQNAFPLHRHEHEQDGGGPDTDADPVKQIERLALWDNNSSKVVQTNHPNIAQILGDKDLDGEPDGGFRGMLGWMDVIEVHPPEGIFVTPSPDDRRNPIFYWMQLLNLGYRITGVVNTDAHYNFHGSGWLRNYLQSSTDKPAEISIDEMIHSSEHGHLIMTTGPFLEVQLRTGSGTVAISGEDVELGKDDTAKMWVRVQCPNWFDVNRVQIFANGRPLEQLNFTRKSHPEFFSDRTVRFEQEIELPKMDVDTHLIVATIGEELKLGPVMGVDRGELPPVAVANPIFVDVDGGGFKANGDDLGVPFMLSESDKQEMPRVR